MPGSMFQNQQQSNANRGAPFRSGRLQNGKIASGSTWDSFNMPMSSASVTGAPPRTNATSFSSYVQTVSGQPPQASLDPSEFPSLSSAPQPQNQNSAAHAIWANPTIRNGQSNSVRRTQNSIPSSQNSINNHIHHIQSNLQESALGTTHGGNSNEEYRFGNQQGNPGQLSGLAQTQPGNAEDFPPLERSTSEEVDHERRSRASEQSAAPGGGGARNDNVGAMSKNGTLGEQENGHSDNINSSGVIGGQVSRQSRNLSNATYIGTHQSQGPLRAGSITEPPPQQPQQQQHQNQQPPQPLKPHSQQQGLSLPPSHHLNNQAVSPEAIGSPSSTLGPASDRLSQMTELERFGLPGLLAMISDHSPDHSTLATGQDLTVVGLDLNRPDNSPLYPTFATPFSEPNSRPVVPEFTLPVAYTVTNVPPLHTKMSSFSDETLFAIFYQYPRDIMQEIAAGELYSRDWRWHKELRQWMMKDNSYGLPIRITDKQERGFYIFFDVTNWRRERREFLLTYDHLDQRHGPPQQLPSVV